MALVDHLRELRNRVVKSVLAIVLLTIVAGFYHKQLTDFLLHPLPKCDSTGVATNGQRCTVVSTIGLVAPFSLALRVALTAGLVAATPVWLYQLWAFVAPGLHR